MPEETTPPARPQAVEVALQALGICLTLAAAVAAIYASGWHLSQPIGKAHIVPLGVIIVVPLMALLLGLETKALRDGRATLLVVAAGAVVIAGVVVLVLSPTPSLSTPVGAALPWLVISLVAALLGAGALVLVHVIRRRHGINPDTFRMPLGPARGVLAVALAVVLVVGLSIGAQHLASGYLDAVNEYRENPISSTESPVTSSLTGGALWQVSLPPDPWLQALDSPYGIVVSQRSGITELDPTTGQVRWHYARSDTDHLDNPQVWALHEGQELAVRWDETSFYVLNARTGARVTRWPAIYVKDRVQGDDPTLLETDGQGDQTTLTAVNDRGDRQWRYTPPDCNSASGVRTATAALVQLHDSCGHAQQLVGLDTRSGRQRWAIETGPVTFQALTDTTAVVSDATAQGPTALTGIDTATGSTRWHTAIRAQGRPCPVSKIESQASSLAVICEVGPPGSHSTRVLRFDVETGKLLDQADLGTTQVMQSAAVTADGRVVIVAQSFRSPGCLVTVVRPDGSQTRLQNVTIGKFCGDTVQALGNQVLVVDFGTDQIRALR